MVSASCIITSVLVTLASLARAQHDPNITPYMPIVVPLAVRSPYTGAYLGTWRQNKNLATQSPTFWSRSPIGWTGLVRVDGEVFNWMGNLTAWPAARNVSFTHTASSSIFTFEVGPAVEPTASVTATFHSPVTPTDLLRQSIPFSYLSVSVRSLDGQDHAIEVYTDINGLWAADEEEEILEWSHVSDKEQATWKGSQFRLQNQRPWQESNDRILYGDIFYAARTDAKSSVTTTVAVGGDSTEVRNLFASSGSTGEQVNSTYRATRTRQGKEKAVIDEPVFALSHSFGMVSPSTVVGARSAVIAVGHVRDPVTRYMTSINGTQDIQELRPLWASKWESPTEMLGFFLSDFENVFDASSKWEQQLEADAKRVHGQDYADVVQISTRQIFMALEAVWDERAVTSDMKTKEGTPAMIMLKEISSNGNCQTVDVIAPFLPFLVYADPKWIPMLMEPILRYHNTGFYRPIPPTHDLGDRYPNATGRNDFVYANLPLEETGNMLNMLYAARRFGVGKEQLAYYWPIVKSWAHWMRNETLYPVLQRSTDDFFGLEANQTSLTIKGLVGMAAMSMMSKSLGDEVDHVYYRDLAVNLTETFLEIGISHDQTHLVGTYSKQKSWVTQYNLYYDKLLGTNLFPASVTTMQDAWYLKHAQPFGPALDSRVLDRAKTDFLMWTAGAANDSDTKDLFVNAVANYFKHDANEVFGDLITPDAGWSVGFLSRPVVGGHFSLVALDAMNTKSVWPLNPNASLFGSIGGKFGDLAGQLGTMAGQLGTEISDIKTKLKDHPSALGGFAFLFALLSFFVVWRIIRRRRRSGYGEVSGHDVEFERNAASASSRILIRENEGHGTPPPFVSDSPDLRRRSVGSRSIDYGKSVEDFQPLLARQPEHDEEKGMR